MLDSINTKYRFSLYKNLMTVEKPDEDIDVNQLYEIIKYGYVRDAIEKLRELAIPDRIVEYKEFKRKMIPYITVSGTFMRRNGEGLLKHSGLMQIDIDKVEEYGKIFDKLCCDKLTYMCFKSPGGKGIKAIVKIHPEIETHKGQFLALDNYYTKMFGIKIDGQCKDLSRAMLLSYDPDIFCNPFSEIFKEVFEPKHYERNTAGSISRVRDSVPASYTDEDIDYMERLLYELEICHIDLTAVTENWIRLGYAICETFGEPGRVYYHRISKMYPRYTFDETEKKFTSLLSGNQGYVTIRTIMYLARKEGVYIIKR